MNRACTQRQCIIINIINFITITLSTHHVDLEFFLDVFPQLLSNQQLVVVAVKLATYVKCAYSAKKFNDQLVCYVCNHAPVPNSNTLSISSFLFHSLLRPAHNTDKDSGFTWFFCPCQSNKDDYFASPFCHCCLSLVLFQPIIVFHFVTRLLSLIFILLNPWSSQTTSRRHQQFRHSLFGNTFK